MVKKLVDLANVSTTNANKNYQIDQADAKEENFFAQEFNESQYSSFEVFMIFLFLKTKKIKPKLLRKIKNSSMGSQPLKKKILNITLDEI